MSEQEPNNISPVNIVRDRSIQLFTYVRELAQLRSKVIRTLNDYESVLWFSDIPREQECFTQAWGAQLEGQEDVWLEIKKPKTPRVPSVPDELRPWVNEASTVFAFEVIPTRLQRESSTVPGSFRSNAAP